MKDLHLLRWTSKTESKSKRFGKNHFLVLMKFGIIVMLCALNFSIFAQTPEAINAVRTAINNATLLSQSVSMGGTGAGYEWYVIIRKTDNVTGEKYALLISKHRIINQGIAFNTNGGNCYEGSSLQSQITNTEYKFLPEVLKAIAVKPKPFANFTSLTEVSEPTSTMASTLSSKKDILFAPSYAEVRIWNNGNAPLPLRSEMHSYQVNRWWTRTASTCTGGTNYAWEINVPADAFVCTAHVMGSNNSGATGVGFVGAIWVKYSSDLLSVSGTVLGLPNSTGVQVCYKINNGAQQCVTTTAGGAYKIMGIPSGANVQIIPVDQPGYLTSITFSNPITNITTDQTGKDIKYCPIASFKGATLICEGATTQLSPTSGGIWASSNEDVAIVNNSGLVTAVGMGTATFTFTGTGISAGCSSTTGTLTVKPAPYPGTVSGFHEVTVGKTITMSNPEVSGGYWNSANPTIATVNTTTGVVTGISAGVATIEYVVVNDGCTSTSSKQINVIPTVLVHSATISVSKNPVCPNDQVIFTVTSYNSGASPKYKWKLDGTIISTVGPSIIFIPQNGDVITCEVTSSDSSAIPNVVTTNSITMQVITPGERPSITISVE